MKQIVDVCVCVGVDDPLLQQSSVISLLVPSVDRPTNWEGIHGNLQVCPLQGGPAVDREVNRQHEKKK